MRFIQIVACIALQLVLCCSADRYKVHHVYHNPLLTKKRKKKSKSTMIHYDGAPRFEQFIENKWTGDDGPVTPPLNIHLEAITRLGSPMSDEEIFNVQEETAALREEEAAEFEKNKIALSSQTKLVDSITNFEKQMIANWVETMKRKKIKAKLKLGQRPS